MKLTSRGRYAVRAILDIASCENSNPISLSDVASRQSISLSYLEQLFSKLKKAGIVKSVRGPKGGYLINGPLDSIYVGQIIDAVSDVIEATECGGDDHRDCKKGDICLSHNLWVELNYVIENYLMKVSLFDALHKGNFNKYANLEQIRIS